MKKQKRDRISKRSF